MPANISPLELSFNISEKSWELMQRNPKEYKLLHDFAAKKLTAFLRGKTSQEAVTAASIKACSAILKSSNCQAAIRKVSKSFGKARKSDSRTRHNNVRVLGVVGLGVGGAVVVVAAAFVVGFIIGTAIAKHWGI